VKYIIILFVLLASGALAYLAVITPPEKYLQFYELTERSLHRFGGYRITDFLEQKAKVHLGYCEAASSPGKQINTAAIPDKLPYAVPFLLNEFSVVCQFSSSPKTFMLAGSAGITLLRAPWRLPTISVYSGKVQVISEKLNIGVRLKSFDLVLSSDGPVRVAIFEEESKAMIIPLFGTVNFSYEVRAGAEEQPLEIRIAEEGIIHMNGKPLPMHENMTTLLPSGFKELPPAIPPAP